MESRPPRRLHRARGLQHVPHPDGVDHHDAVEATESHLIRHLQDHVGGDGQVGREVGLPDIPECAVDLVPLREVVGRLHRAARQHGRRPEEPVELQVAAVRVQEAHVPHEASRPAGLVRVLHHQEVSPVVLEQGRDDLGEIVRGREQAGALDHLVAPRHHGRAHGAGEPDERGLREERGRTLELPGRGADLGAGVAQRRGQRPLALREAAEAATLPSDPLGRADEGLAGVGGDRPGVDQMVDRAGRRR